MVYMHLLGRFFYNNEEKLRWDVLKQGACDHLNGGLDIIPADTDVCDQAIIARGQ